MTRITAVWILSLTFSISAFAQSPKVAEYRLDVSFFPEESRMVGRVGVRCEAGQRGDSAIFYLHGELAVDSIIAENRSMAFNQSSVFYDFDYSLVATRVTFDATRLSGVQLTVFYQGFFSPSKARSQSDYMRIDHDGVFLRAYGYSPWFPIFLEAGDDSYEVDFSDVTIRTPVEYIPIFAGERISEDTANGRRASRWRAPGLDLFAAQCTAQKYAVTSERNITLYHSDDSASLAMNGQILAFVRSLSTAYRERYCSTGSAGHIHIMEMPQFGDISSGNVTGITSGIWKTFDKNIWSRRGLAHELVHPYVALGLGRTDSLYALAIEGFPSYFHLPVLGEMFGDGWYEIEIEQIEAEYLKKRRTGLGWRDRPVPKERPLLQISAQEVGQYKDVFVLDDRALLFCDWMRREMGATQFVTFTRELFNGEAASYESFRRLILKYLPAADDDIRTWLCTTEFPDRFRIAKD